METEIKTELSDTNLRNGSNVPLSDSLLIDQFWSESREYSLGDWGQKESHSTEVSLEYVGEDLLKDVPAEDIPDMLFRMERNYPLAVHAHEHVRTLLRWKMRNPEIKISILAPEGDYKKGIIFFSLFQGCFNGSVYCHNNEEKKELQNALATTKHLSLFYKTLSRLTCMNVLSYKAFHPSKQEWCTSVDLVLWLPWYCARELEVNLPEGTEIKDLSSEHIFLVNELWPDHYPGSEDLIAEMIDINVCLGVFRDSCLLSWALSWCHGGIGLIQTLEQEKLKGYSRAVVEAVAKKMGEHQIDVHLNIANGKTSELAFFRAIGFRYGFESYSSETKNNGKEVKSRDTNE